MFSTVCLLVLCSFILNRNILGFSGVEREIVILCNVMLSKILLDPSLKGFLSKFYCKLSHPILNGYKLVVPATFLCPVVHNALVALFVNLPPQAKPGSWLYFHVVTRTRRRRRRTLTQILQEGTVKSWKRPNFNVFQIKGFWIFLSQNLKIFRGKDQL